MEDKTLRILQVLDVPWDKRLAVANTRYQLAARWRAQGHQVDKFSYEDAFPREARSRLMRELRPHFSRRAIEYVRSVASRYDIVEAQQGCLPVSRHSLGLAGLLVTRSAGLFTLHGIDLRNAYQRWPHARGKFVARPLRSLRHRRHMLYCRRSIEHCDLFVAINTDEMHHMKASGLGQQTVLIPVGIEGQLLDALKLKDGHLQSRLAHPELVFIGRWSLLKGTADWGTIAACVRAAVPNARFSFLGVGKGMKNILLNDLGLKTDYGIRVIEQFDREELPALLSNATVGLLPSYSESFGKGALEQLAAGVPTIAYDVSGPRETVGRVSRSLIVPVGDAQAIANRAIELLRADPYNYLRLARRCREVAQEFSWDDIAPRAIEIYREHLESLITP